MVGRTLATRLVGLGHEVAMGARQAGSERGAAWVAATGAGSHQGTFADAAAFGEVVVNATSGAHCLEALRAAGAAALAGKVLVDVSNPIAPGNAFPPVLGVCNDDSMAEQIQRAFPQARVVKTLNTVNASVMVDPTLVPGRHNLFVCGEDPAAKAVVTGLLGEFGWPAEDVIDLGPISAARGLEMYLPLWLRLMVAGGSPAFNILVQRAPVAAKG